MHVLETPRLILRPPSYSDELLLHGLYSDPFMVNSVGDGVYPTIEESKARLLRSINHWRRNHFGLWMVFVKIEGEAIKFAGLCGLECCGNVPEDPNLVEHTTYLHLAAAGQGIGPEAGRGTVQFAFEYLALEKVAAFIRPTNKRSLRGASKVGFFYVGNRTYNNMTFKYFEICPATAIKSNGLLVSAYTDPELSQIRQ
ncbi:GNAT family N-acetyltransferase [Mesorhizobium sp. M0809]|uniref:GNAT family N-acetyltransferase n=1 Tax=Mesorhizobium sp. M0809 TaxID=2957003 RepID=UPI0033355F27